MYSKPSQKFPFLFKVYFLKYSLYKNMFQINIEAECFVILSAC
jgi:hypothetical protein